MGEASRVERGVNANQPTGYSFQRPLEPAGTQEATAMSTTRETSVVDRVFRRVTEVKGLRLANDSPSTCKNNDIYFNNRKLFYSACIRFYFILCLYSFFVKNENCSRYILITYNEFQPKVKVENSGLSYWDHNEGELLQKIVFILSNVALLSANRAGFGYIFHVPESIQIADWNVSVIIANKNLTMVHIFWTFSYCFQIF